MGRKGVVGFTKDYSHDYCSCGFVMRLFVDAVKE